jgi:hypothetical protein
MTISSLFISIVSSSLLATIVTSLITFYSKKTDFRNEYFKIVIKKRLDAYEKLEFVIAILKTSALDENDGKAYHLPFFNPDNWMEFSANLALTNSYSLWLNESVNEKLSGLISDINQIRFEYDITKSEVLIEAGKKSYDSLASARVELENMARKDVLSLYDFQGISRKKVKDQLQVISIKKKN